MVAKKQSSRPEEKSLIFRNVRIRYLDMRMPKEGAHFVRLHLSSDLSEPLMEALNLNIGEGIESGKFIATVLANSLTLTANQQRVIGTGSDECQLECRELSDFSFVERKNDEGDAQGFELRFIARTLDANAESTLGLYWRAIGKGDSQMKVGFISLGQTEADPAAVGNTEEADPVKQ